MTHTGGSYNSQKVVVITHSWPQGGSYDSQLTFKCGSYDSQLASNVILIHRMGGSYNSQSIPRSIEIDQKYQKRW